MKGYDIVLVLGHFRAAAAYLSVIRHMSPTARIALIPAQVEPSYLRKTVDAQAVFLQLCQKFGAELLDQGARATAGLMVVQQYPYPAETAATMLSTISAKRRVGMMGLATAGLPKHDSFLRLFDIEKVYVPNVRLMRFLLGERGGSESFRNVQATQVGLPFRRYPIFDDFEVDYLIAAPTVFSFHSERGKHEFLRTVIKLLEQIPATARIAYKTHNGASRDYFAPKVEYAIGRILRPIPGATQAVARLAQSSPSALRRRAESVVTGLLHMQALRRAVPLTRITPYADISLEAFLPGVRQGVIGGLSNVIWGTLYSQLPYYNCIAPEHRAGSSELMPNRSSDLLLDLNLKFFGVPYCQGDLACGALGQSIVTEQDRQGDIIEAIQSDLGAT